jgi:pimeloyl-ACP methyl ester carboxylesterase
MEKPINYAVHEGVHIAYQVVGDGPIDLVYTPGIWSNLEIMWEWPAWARYLNRLASFSRLIMFDMRGVGLSDRGPEPPVLELQMDDVRAVMDAAGSDTAAIFGGARGGAMTLLFAATYPERARALILYAPFAKTLRAPDWPYGRSEEEQLLFFIAARVAAGAGPPEVRVSRTVKDLVAGSGIRFIDLGAHSLKGVPGEWVLFRVEQ